MEATAHPPSPTEATGPGLRPLSPSPADVNGGSTVSAPPAAPAAPAADPDPNGSPAVAAALALSPSAGSPPTRPAAASVPTAAEPTLSRGRAPTVAGAVAGGRGPAQKRSTPVKAVSNWRKVIKWPSSSQDPGLVAQLFQPPLPAYIPCVPLGTSQRLIASLRREEVEQLCCPGCQDRFLLPHTFLQHVYRRSLTIHFDCQLCQKSLAFHNRCHLKLHALSHMETDGVTVVRSQALAIAPLALDQLPVGCRDPGYALELDRVHASSGHARLGQCSECRLSLETHQLPAHFRLGGPPDRGQACRVCGQVLPNPCSLAAHERIHERQRPYCCPECGAEFQTWSTFQHHVQKTCQHEFKVWTLACRLCRRKGCEPSQALVQAQNLVGHVIDHHVKLFYKCSSCAKAFDTKEAIYQHRDECHAQASDLAQAAFSILYQANFLRKGRIFSSVEALERRMETLSRDWSRDFVFQCPSCRQFFEDGAALADHNARWCEMQLFKENLDRSRLFPSDREIQATEKRIKLKECWKILHDICPRGCAECHETLLNLKCHLGTHFEIEDPSPTSGQSASPPHRRISSVSRSLEPGTPEPKRRRKTRSSAAQIEPKKVEETQPRSPSPPPTQTLEAVKVEAVELKPKVDVPDDVKKVPKKKLKAKLAKREGLKPFVESLGLGIPSAQRLLAMNQLGRQALAVGSSVSDTRSQNAFGQASSELKCALCEFSCTDDSSFASHIRIHRPAHLDEGDYFQCWACGMCFASESAGKKHLFLLHRIKIPELEDDLPVDTEGSAMGSLDQPAVSDEELVKDTPTLSFKSRDNVCQVCSLAFSNQVELSRHFRSHGMAFLKSGSTNP